jgi:threonine synthase
LASANSISLGRLLPQMTYYASAAGEHFEATGERLHFSIPTGNVGNAFACLLARAMGVPIGDVALASNANQAVPHFVRSGDLAHFETVSTLANAMDVARPSNLERVQWLATSVGPLNLRAESVSDEEIGARICEGEPKYGHTWCPHTACAIEAVERLRRAGDSRTWCIVATAHPSKFETIVEPRVGHRIDPPAALARLLAAPSHVEPLEPFSLALSRVLRRLG